jgi:aspartate carbamoyltransferase regulatory subunit
MEKTLTVSAIKKGTVIDHIVSGQALKIVHLLQLVSQKHLVSIGIHLPSATLGRKDLIKIEDRFLSQKEAHDIAIFAPQATISIIENYKVIKKMKAELPDVVEKILICPNPRCIMHSEPVDSVFFVGKFGHKILLQCKFCERSYERDLIKDYRT